MKKINEEQITKIWETLDIILQITASIAAIILLFLPLKFITLRAIIKIIIKVLNLKAIFAFSIRLLCFFRKP